MIEIYKTINRGNDGGIELLTKYLRQCGKEFIGPEIEIKA